MMKFERRVELAMECDRFFDLVRWGEAAEVLNKYYAEEAADCSIYSNASFTKTKRISARTVCTNQCQQWKICTELR